MSELISEPIKPLGAFNTARMARGEPGLPGGFIWRGETATVVEEIEAWKESSREGGVGELYLRRHCFRLRMSNGRVWTVYFTRQAPKSGNPRRRWFLYTVENEEPSRTPNAKQPVGKP